MRDWEAERQQDAALVEAAHERAEAAETALTVLRARLRDLRDQWEGWSAKKYREHELDAFDVYSRCIDDLSALLVDPLTRQEEKVNDSDTRVDGT